jgi:hypothetical protein
MSFYLPTLISFSSLPCLLKVALVGAIALNIMTLTQLTISIVTLNTTTLTKMILSMIMILSIDYHSLVGAVALNI